MVFDVVHMNLRYVHMNVTESAPTAPGGSTWMVGGHARNRRNGLAETAQIGECTPTGNANEVQDARVRGRVAERDTQLRNCAPTLLCVASGNR